MILNQLKILLHKFHQHHTDELAPEIRHYIENCEYPKNHTYFICHKQLLPTRKLSTRVKKISIFYPQNLESFLDLSCCRGYFVFSASTHRHCQRSLGIDVDPINIEACRALKTYLNLDQPHKPQFELLTLETLANQISHFGGAYQTVLLTNTYQYLFFGSDRWPGYLSHEKIFSYFNEICSDRLIFSNRIELAHCQNRVQVEQAGILKKNYNSSALITAASKYFEIIPQGKIGQYPLWVLKKR